MTAGTGTNNLRMVDCAVCNRRPLRGEPFMAGVTKVCGINMRCTLARGSCTVMTGYTVINKRRVVYRGRYPLLGTVADTAFFGGWNMRSGFARRYHVVMTG